MKKLRIFLFFFFMTLRLSAQVEVDPNFYHLRNTEPREWSDFPKIAFRKELVIDFKYEDAKDFSSLSVRQKDVKLTWVITLNGHRIGTLQQNEADLLSYFDIAKSNPINGNNTIRIYSDEKVADDIWIGELKLFQKEVSELLEECTISLKASNEIGKEIPARFTIINQQRVLQPVFTSTEDIAARTGNIYSPTGHAYIQLPAGRYTIFAGRGFEYSIDSTNVEIKEGENLNVNLKIKREVNSEGWISCDPHVHTFTYSRHGDATDRARVITLAAEHIELPIITDHNQHIDLSVQAQEIGVRKFFTPIVGNEVTTKVGHFNVFPLAPKDSVADFKAYNWTELKQTISGYPGKKVIILNHARDIHNNFRPHDPTRFLSIAGQRLDGEPIFANAMEVVNSGSQQSDWMQLFNDWMHLLNGGHELTPVGSSDSHDVSRFIVGQGRTYIRGNDSSPDAIDIHEVVDNFLNGKVMVSCGLLASLKINNAFGPGELATVADEVIAGIEVSGPSWSKADKIVLYINGEKFKEEKISDKGIGGVKWSGKWTLPKYEHDYHVVAIAEGPGDHMVFWPIAKPYQPTSPDWTPRVIGATGAVWVDADGNGKRESAYDYAKKVVSQASGNIARMIALLQQYDESVAIQVAAILHLNNIDLTSGKIQRALKNGSEKTRRGFQKVIAETKISNTQ